MDISDIISDHLKAATAERRRDARIQHAVLGTMFTAGVAGGVLVGVHAFVPPEGASSDEAIKATLMAGLLGMGVMIAVFVIGSIVIMGVLEDPRTPWGYGSSPSSVLMSKRIGERIRNHYGAELTRRMLGQLINEGDLGPELVRMVDGSHQTVRVEIDLADGRLEVFDGVGEELRELEPSNGPVIA